MDIEKKDLQKLLLELDKVDGILAEYGDLNFYGIRSVLLEAVEIEMKNETTEKLYQSINHKLTDPQLLDDALNKLGLNKQNDKQNDYEDNIEREVE